MSAVGVSAATTTDKVGKAIFLSEGDKEIVCRYRKLTDSHMETAMTLLKHQFIKTEGLESTLLAQSCRGFSVQVDNSALVVQIHHTGADHWVTSMRGYGDDEVKVYDSLLTFDRHSRPLMTQSLKVQLAQIYRSSGNEIAVLYPEMTRQNNAVDCGVFALATATDICFGRDPAQCSYDKLSMRPHLLKCIEQQWFEPFPSSHISRSNSFYIPVAVYCYCRRPESHTMIDCIACSEQFHYECINYTGGDFRCSGCGNRPSSGH